jgi:hypothetical protein
MLNCIPNKGPAHKYVPATCKHEMPYHIWAYPLGAVYARTLNEADEMAIENGLGNRSEMWW